jgi:hypothetical protein
MPKYVELCNETEDSPDNAQSPIIAKKHEEACNRLCWACKRHTTIHAANFQNLAFFNLNIQSRQPFLVCFDFDKINCFVTKFYPALANEAQQLKAFMQG